MQFDGNNGIGTDPVFSSINLKRPVTSIKVVADDTSEEEYHYMRLELYGHRAGKIFSLLFSRFPMVNSF